MHCNKRNILLLSKYGIYFDCCLKLQLLRGYEANCEPFIVAEMRSQTSKLRAFSLSAFRLEMLFKTHLSSCAHSGLVVYLDTIVAQRYKAGRK